LSESEAFARALLSMYYQYTEIESLFFVTELGCVRGDTIRAMDANTTNTVLGANNAIALASSMNESSVALVVAFKQRDIFVEIRLM